MMTQCKMIALAVLLVSVAILPQTSVAQGSKEKIISESAKAKSAFIQTDASMKKMFAGAYGYVIFPHVGKGAVIVGGASGKGTLYEKGKATGTAHMTQATVGAQIGGKSYREVIFFETKEALDHFRENKFEFSGGIAAVAVKSGVSDNAKYAEGVAVFTQDKGGLMADVSVGGQKFSYKPL